MLAITVPFLEKFACVVAGKIVGLSRHPDYFEYHYRLRDLKKIRIEGLTKFIRVNGQGQVESIVLTEALLTKGAKIESQPVESLTDEEKVEIAAAIELVNQPPQEEQPTNQQSDTETESEGAEATTDNVDETPDESNVAATSSPTKKSRPRPNRRR